MASKKIGAILAGVVLLPLIVYTFLGIRQSKENEAMIHEIYNRQLDAILFSINQYSNDILSGLTNKLEFIDPFEDESYLELIKNYRILGHYIQNHATGKDTTIVDEGNGQTRFILDSIRSDENMVKDRLIRYRQSNFKKLEPIPIVSNDGYQAMAFVTEPTPGQYIYYEVVIEASRFIEMFIKPKVQQVAMEGFVMTIRHAPTRNVLYQTGQPENPDVYTKNLWFFQDYNLEISIRGESLAAIARSRANFNIMLIIFVLAILIIGVWLVFHSIDKEMRLAQAKSDFVSNVSHEIRTPLSLISMFAETLLLDRVEGEDKKREYYGVINKEAARLRNIVNKILNFAQIEANKKRYHTEACDLNEIAQDVLSVYSFHLENKGFVYESEFFDGELPILADKEAVTEALINLLENAIKYCGENKRLVMVTMKKDQICYVEVRDFGVGIPAKAIHHIFDKFYRITEGDIYKVQGAGLGLSIVKHIMDAHEGTVEVESTLGMGSTFRLVFKLN